MRRKKKDSAPDGSELGVIDCETDPFKHGRVPAPFAIGVLWRGSYAWFTGDDCVQRAVDYILSIKVPVLWYAHNGGKFDYFFFITFLENPIKLINSRIVSSRLGIHELRDSWAIMPFALATYSKTPIDYGKFEPDVRHLHMVEICDYLHDDCVDLMTLCEAFVKRFGPRLTVAGTAMKELQKFHPQEFCHESHDDKFRDFYFGGRVECFRSGVIEGNFKVYDVNSMYPKCMRDFDHPIGGQYVSVSECTLDACGWIRGFSECMYFCEVEGHNLGALPTRGIKTGQLTFTEPYGVFHTTSHELRCAIELGKFKVHRILKALIPINVQRFDDFVNHFADEKAKADKAGDKIGRIFAKLMMNSAYGKFGQDPRKFEEYMICIRGIHQNPPEPWELKESAEKWSVWAKPSPTKRFFDVAIAASVTSAARAVLLRGISGALNPVYCDTDSIICEELMGVPLDEYELGAWKLEASGNRIAVAGKKLYALFDGDRPVKWASKGTKLSPIEVEKVASGGEVLWQSEAPNFSLTGTTKFVARVSRMTA